MLDSSTVRKINKNKIRRIMMDGGAYTKQNIAKETGLCVATCNTLLNELAGDGEVLGDKQRLNDVGRSTVVYHMNDDYAYYFLLALMRREDSFYAVGTLMTPTKKVRDSYEVSIRELGDIKSLIHNVKSEYPALSHVVIGLPAIVTDQIVTVSEIPFLNGMKASDFSEDSLTILLENDMHLKAYGYYCRTKDEADVVTLCYFNSHSLPVSATVHKGSVIKGAQGFAGHVGYLPFGMKTEEVLTLMKASTCLPMISRVISSIVAVINPDKVIVAGDLIEERRLPLLEKNALKNTPEAYFPRLLAVKSFDEYYREGMFERIIQEKEKY